MKRTIHSICFLTLTLSLSNCLHAQIQKGIDLDGEVSNDKLGSSVSMPDANTVAIGAPYKHINTGNGADYGGQVKIMEWNGSSWQQKGTTIDGTTNDEYLGNSVSMPDANTLAVGSSRINAWTGMVQIRTFTGGGWTLKGMPVFGEAEGDYFGYSISMPDANTVAIGAINNDGNGPNAGHVRIFSWNGTAWVQKGTDLDGEAASDAFGYSVCMPDANTVAIGGYGNDGNGTDAGHVRVFSWDGTAWIQKGIDIDGEAAGDQAGNSLCMPDANTLAIGGWGNDANGFDAGHVRVFTWSGSAWIQIGSDIDGEAAGDYFGNALSMPDANTLAVSSFRNDNNGSDAGSVRVFKWNSTSWVQEGIDIDGEASMDRSGTSVSMPDANTLAIGSPENDVVDLINETTIQSAGHVRVFTMSQAGIQGSLIQSFNLYPNPASNELNIITSLSTKVQITSSTGTIITEIELNGETTIDVSTYAPGVYFIRTAEGQTVKFVKE